MASRFLFARVTTAGRVARAEAPRVEAPPVAAPVPSKPSAPAAKLTGVFGTETVAELCVKQGRPEEAVAIFERLLARKPDDARADRWRQRIRDLAASTPGPDVDVSDLVSPDVAPALAADGGAASGATVASDAIVPGAVASVAAVPGTMTFGVPVPGTAVPSAVSVAFAPAPSSSSTFASPVNASAPVVVAPRVVRRPPVVPAAPTWSPALVIREPVRSGQVIYAEGRDLVVLAPVSSGAELIADGHIHVHGALRGRAVAGARGAQDALIYCQRLEAELIGVDDAHLTAEDFASTWRGRAVLVQLVDGALQVTPVGLTGT